MAMVRLRDLLKLPAFQRTYKSVEECIAAGAHLEDCDEDGYCNACGHQERDEEPKVKN